MHPISGWFVCNGQHAQGSPLLQGNSSSNLSVQNEIGLKMSFCRGCRKERVSASHSFPHLETDGDSGSRYNQYSLQQEVQYRAAKHCGYLNCKASPICPLPSPFRVYGSRMQSTQRLLLFCLYHHFMSGFVSRNSIITTVCKCAPCKGGTVCTNLILKYSPRL